MSSLPSPIPIPKPNTSRTCFKGASFSNSQCRLCLLPRQRKPVSLSIGIGCRFSSSVFVARSSLEQPEVVEETFMEWDTRNPAISSMYRCPKIPRPNQIVLEAQAKVCTGPEQTRPLTEEQAVKVLDTILKSVTTKSSRAHHEKTGSSSKPHHPGHSEKGKCELICGTSSWS